jgi:hypothetical protein
MSLPNRGAAVYVSLASPDGDGIFPAGAVGLDPGTVVGDYHTPNPPPESPPPPASQQNFYSYVSLFPNYPEEVVVKVATPLDGQANLVILSIDNSNLIEASLLYPVNPQNEYNPGPPLYPGGPSYEPVPNPNGQPNTVYDSDFFIDPPDPVLVPRWHTATAFDYSSSAGSPDPYTFFVGQGVVPEKGKVYQIYATENYTNPANGIAFENRFVGSWDIQATNLNSAVLNQQTGVIEFYPFSQATTEFKATSNYIIPNLFEICCWNKGTVVKGKVAIYSVNVITAAIPSVPPGYYMGITAEIGTTFAPVSEVAWEVTIDDGYTPVEITIPQVAGKCTFVNDFWVTEVTPPT